MVGFVYPRIAFVFGLIQPTVTKNAYREKPSFWENKASRKMICLIANFLRNMFPQMKSCNSSKDLGFFIFELFHVS